MGMRTSATVEIAAPIAEVFSWLVEPGKLTAWLGGPGGMPDDPSQLHEGATMTAAAPGIAGGEVTMRIDAWDPPNGYTVTSTYPGGSQRVSYRLAGTADRTSLTCEGESDWAEPDPSRMDAALAGQPAEWQQVARAWVEQMLDRVDEGAYDAMAQPGLQAALEEQLAKLKQLVESA